MSDVFAPNARYEVRAHRGGGSVLVDGFQIGLVAVRQASRSCTAWFADDDKVYDISGQWLVDHLPSGWSILSCSDREYAMFAADGLSLTAPDSANEDALNAWIERHREWLIAAEAAFDHGEPMPTVREYMRARSA